MRSIACSHAIGTCLLTRWLMFGDFNLLVRSLHAYRTIRPHFTIIIQYLAMRNFAGQKESIQLSKQLNYPQVRCYHPQSLCFDSLQVRCLFTHQKVRSQVLCNCHPKLCLS